MYVSLTRVNSAGQPAENATMVAEEMNRWLRDIEGYHGFLMLSGDDTTVGLTVWESKAVADVHREARMQFIERMTSIAGVQVDLGIDEAPPDARADDDPVEAAALEQQRAFELSDLPAASIDNRRVRSQGENDVGWSSGCRIRVLAGSMRLVAGPVRSAGGGRRGGPAAR